MSDLAGFCRYELENAPRWGVLNQGLIHDFGDDDAVERALVDGSVEVLGGALSKPGIIAPLLPPLLPGARIFCVGLNFGKHVAETGHDVSEFPVIFSRTHESFVGHNQPILRPPESVEFDFEGELALVIGMPGRRISEANAPAHIAGYTLANDGTIRDWQFHTHQYLPGKNFEASGGMGPAIWPAALCPQITKEQLKTEVAGEVLQSAPLSDLIFPFGRLVAYLSTFTTLKVGDVILTGTPDGVGFKRDPKRFLAKGDMVVTRVSGLGRLVNSVQEERV